MTKELSRKDLERIIAGALASAYTVPHHNTLEERRKQGMMSRSYDPYSGMVSMSPVTANEAAKVAVHALLGAGVIGP